VPAAEGVPPAEGMAEVMSEEEEGGPEEGAPRCC
jgi:hypothetical protein